MTPSRTDAVTYSSEEGDITVPVFDVDDTPLPPLLIEVKRLQHVHGLGDASIYKSSENCYHVYFFGDVHTDWNDFLEILEESPLVEDAYTDHVQKTGKGRMRLETEHVRDIPSTNDGDDRFKQFFKRFHEEMVNVS